jgi:hypothetical protein
VLLGSAAVARSEGYLYSGGQKGAGFLRTMPLHCPLCERTLSTAGFRGPLVLRYLATAKRGAMLHVL